MEETITEYQIVRANWHGEDVFDDGGAFVCLPSNEIDDRTIDQRTFDTKEEALEYAEHDFNQRIKSNNEKWMAYYVVLEVKKTIVKDFKGSENMNSPIHEW